MLGAIATGRISARAQQQNGSGGPTCALMPIATSQSAIAGVPVGGSVTDILNSDRPGNRGWLTWSGDVGEPALVKSLGYPGNGDTYRNPDDASDSVISKGDWIRGSPGVVNSRGVRDALDGLEARQIVVPLWDATRSQGSGTAYRVSGFAKFSITAYRLTSKDNSITARYLGPTDCGGTTGASLHADDATASTSEDRPVSVVIMGHSSVPEQLTFVLGSPQHGSVAFGGASTCTTSAGVCTVTVLYTPAHDANGTDQFTFAVADATATSAPGTVTVTVSPVNDPPTTSPDAFTTLQDTALQVTAAQVLANDSPGPPDEASQTLTVGSVGAGPASHGTATLTGGTIVYTPDGGYVGPATITYTACDNGTTGGQPDPRCSDGTISITVTPNHPPTATGRRVTTPEDTALPIVLSGDDPDGQALTFSVTAPPAHGALAGATPNLVYTPDPDYNGPDSLAFVANDGHAASAPATIEITVTEVNDPPSARSDSFSVGAGEPTQIPGIAVLHNDVAGPANESGQTLRIGAVAATPDTHGTVSVAADSTITYTPAAGYVGPASFTYDVCDNGTTNGSPDPLCAHDGQVSLTVVAPDRPPTADSQQVVTAEDTMPPILLTGSDPDGDPITYSIVGQPKHGTLLGVAPAVTYIPSSDYFGSDEFTFVTNDGRAHSELATVSIRVTEVNDPPVLGPDSATLGGAGTLGPPPERPDCQNPCGIMWGDPHNVTFDVGAFDFQGVGEFVAVKSLVDDYEIQIRTKPYGTSRHVAVIDAVGMRVAGHRVAIYAGTPTRTLLDGNAISVPSDPMVLPGGGSVGTYGATNEVVVVWPDGSTAFVKGADHFDVDVGLAAARRTHVVGLLGNADGNRANDVVTRDGRQLSFPPVFADLYPAYADSWRISQAESLFDYGAGQTTETFTDRTFPDGPETPATLDPTVRAAATAQCTAAGVAVPELLDACVVDVGVTGDAGYVAGAIGAQDAVFGASFGQPETVTIANPGDTAIRTFTAPAGQLMTLTVSGNTIPGADITIRLPNGATVGSLFVSDPTAFHDTMMLPVAGTYTITFDPRLTNVGSLTFVLGGVPANTGSAAIGTPTTVTIGTVGENAVRSFSALAGQMVTLSVSGNTIPGADLTIRQPNGATVGSLFVSDPTAFHDTMTLPVAGTYTITVDARLT
ncbi:MAG TPA: Ig-like domain-containing protein, partial [Gaiellaceae bacterium]|nr:Ig-like domain-containing protein [Gaiellaceae bacterium]